MPADPVCGMDVNETEALASAEYAGNTYYFCAEGYTETFTAAPADYV